MGKISGYTADTSISSNDSVVGIQASGPSTMRFKFSDIITFLKTNLTGFSNANINVPYKASAYNTGAQTLSSGTVTKVPLDTKTYDTGSNFDNTTNYRFTAPVAGFYIVTLKVQIGSAGISSTADALGFLFKNGSELKRGLQIAGSGNAFTLPASQIVDIVQLSANDYLEMYGVCSEGSRTIVSGNNCTWMSVSLWSAT